MFRNGKLEVVWLVNTWLCVRGVTISSFLMSIGGSSFNLTVSILVSLGPNWVGQGYWIILGKKVYFIMEII